MNTTACRVGLSIVSGFCAGAAQAEDAAQFQEQMTRQQAIYQAKGKEAVEGYVTDRSLDFYAYTLPSEFGQMLPDLGPQDRWLDIGAGMGQAILDYFTPGYHSDYLKGEGLPGGRGQAVAVSMEDRRTPAWHRAAARLGPQRIQYLFDRPLDDYTTAQLGRFRVITDMFGGFSYTDKLSDFMAKTLEFLEVDGSFYTLLQDVQTEKGGNRPYYAGSPYLTELARPDGSAVKVCAWLKSISCVEVSCEAKLDWKPPLEVYRVHKTCGEVRVPPLRRVHYEAGTPPERRFVFRDGGNAPASSAQELSASARAAR